MTNDTSELLDNAARYARAFRSAGGTASPRRRLAVLTCMDARIDPAALLGLRPGDAHIIRNAGGTLTSDARRSLLLSQRALGTREIWLIHHTGCGLEGLDEEAFAADVLAATGELPAEPLGSFVDARADLRSAVAALAIHPHFAGTPVRAFLFDVETGVLEPVE